MTDRAERAGPADPGDRADRRGDAGADECGPRVVLVGPMGAGKSTVAAALGKRLDLQTADTDAWVQERAGCTIPELFAAQGEAAFRVLERETVAAALRSHPGVLALGGGAVLDPRTRAALTGRPVVFLDVSAEEALRRMPKTAARPLLACPDPRSAWAQLAAERRHLYEEVAGLRVDTTGLTADDVATRIAAELGLVRHA